MATLPNPKPTGPVGPTTPGVDVPPTLSGHNGDPALTGSMPDPWRGGTPKAADADVSKGSMGEVKREDAKASKKNTGIKDNKGEGKETVISRTALKHKTPAQKMYPRLKSQDSDDHG